MQYILTVAVVSLVALPETVAEEEPLNVCATLHGVDFTHIPFILNFTISSEQGISVIDMHVMHAATQHTGIVLQ